MYLYEKENNQIKVYELKDLKEKLFDFRRKEMEKNGKNGLVYRVFSNNLNDIYNFQNEEKYDMSKFITKYNLYIKHKKGLKLYEVNSMFENRIIVNGLLYQLYNGDYDCNYEVTKLFEGEEDNIKKYLLLTNSDIKFHKINCFDGESFRYELSNIISLPESIYLLRLLIQKQFVELVDKDIDELLSLYEFNNIPIKKLDIDTMKFINKNYITKKELELDQHILKKVRQIHK